MIRTSTLPSGARVVTEDVPGARSVTAGFWIGVGARDEAPAEAGASHFLEHLLFKGTESRTAAPIAAAVDAVGGEMNAFTAHEHTAFYARLPAGDLDLGLDLLSDVVWRPAFRPDDVEAERRVILEELAMEEDAPDDRVVVLLGEALFPDHPLGREVLGDRDTIGALTRDDIAGFHARWYRPANVVVAVAGAVDHDDVVAGVGERLAAAPGGERPERAGPSVGPVRYRSQARSHEQGHLAIGWLGLPRDDPDRFALAVANQILGGGMSSRLFQSIREERGLAYAVHSYPVSYGDAGALIAYAGTAPERLAEVLGLVEDEVARFVDDGATEEEVRVAVGYFVGSTQLGLEDSGACMARVGRALLEHGSVLELEELLDRYRSVTVTDVERVARRVLADATRSVAVVAPRGRLAPVRDRVRRAG